VAEDHLKLLYSLYLDHPSFVARLAACLRRLVFIAVAAVKD
jgi:hypothetical protein